MLPCAAIFRARSSSNGQGLLLSTRFVMIMNSVRILSLSSVALARARRRAPSAARRRLQLRHDEVMLGTKTFAPRP